MMNLTEFKERWQKNMTNLAAAWQVPATRNKLLGTAFLACLCVGTVGFAVKGNLSAYADDGASKSLSPISLYKEDVAFLVLDDMAEGRDSLSNVIALEQFSFINWQKRNGVFDGGYLQVAPTRLEALILALRLTGQEQAARGQRVTPGQVGADIPQWGRSFIAYAVNHNILPQDTAWLKPITTREYLTLLADCLVVPGKEMSLSALQKYSFLPMNRLLLADISYHFLSLKEVKLDLKTGYVSSVCWGDRLVQMGIISEKEAVLADLPILQNDSYRYEAYFMERLKEDSTLFPFTAKNKAYMNKLMAKTDSYWVLVNKTHPIPADYVPTLITKQTLPAKSTSGLMVPFAYEQLKVLFQGAKADGITMYVRSGYRSYQTQKGLYGDGSNPYRAKPGISEHQTGLAMDVVNQANRLDENLDQSPEALWLRNHAQEYGFIIRYLKEKEAITGYPAEWWHLRYIGKQIAYTCYVNNLTYDEFYDWCQQGL